MKYAPVAARLALWSALTAASALAQATTSQEIDALRQRAFAAEAAHRYADAATAFVALAKAQPDRPDWFVAAARCLGRSGKASDAVDLLADARARFPRAVELDVMLARSLLLQVESESGTLHPEIQWTDAAQLAEQALASVPDHEEARLVLAQARYLLGNATEALAQAQEVVRRNPASFGGHVLLGRLAVDRFRALMQQYELLRPTGQEGADFVAKIDAERQLAAGSYRRAVEIDPSRVFPHLALGQLARLDKKNDVARAHFADALAIDPDAALDHQALGTDLDAAARAAFYGKIRERYAARPDSQPAKLATLRFHEGRALFDGGQWQAARDAFAAAVAADPSATNNQWYLFLCAWRLEDHDGAERHATAYAAAGAPAFADVVRSLQGELRGEVGAVLSFLANRAHAQKRIEVSRDLNHVIACLLDSADAWNNHAFLCRETGRFDDAFASYQHALEKEPDSPQLLNDAAVILQHHLPSPQNNTKARGMYERALQLADKQLADSRITGAQRERIAKAKADATANLAELR